ncbi:sulfite dehydrogenase [Rhodobacteraceae bacterium B1Z28]|uniref:Sulfite dehydrogenase n=1 Tax=Ruegeria haliotis TaxID=2747601 RepID=A0ABX2PUE1_9RHOB|nr:sulfite dehydrogenase [Ruegeria haliotis]NVO56991.1 sulfite dehydrogenase [Ruegeria haliotis]
MLKTTGFVGRRDFLKAGATFLTASSAALPATLTAKGASAAPKIPDNMLYPGVEDEAYGSPSPHEAGNVRKIFPQNEKSTLTASFTPLHTQKGIITPSGLHFGAHHSGVPEIDPEMHELFIHGMTDRPLKFTASDLMRYPLSGGINFLECGGNSAPQGYYPEAQPMPLQYLHGLVSGSEWIGVPVKLLLQEAGLNPKAKWVIAEGADAGFLARSIPLQKLLDDAIIALYQNGERLRPAQGYPMRLFLPGWEGNTSIKWLRRLEVTDRPAYTREESRHYSETLADGSIEGFSMYMGVKSVITHPSAGQVLPDKGYYQVNGLAWSGFGKISRVEVSDDGGKNWVPAELEGPVLNKSLTRFTLPWRWDGSPVRLQSRAFDEWDNVQPTHEAWKSRYFEGSRNHYNAIQTWYIDAQGTVSNVF